MIRDPQRITKEKRTVTEIPPRMLLRRFLYRIRWRLILAGREVFGDTSADALAGIMLGQRSLMDREQKLLYQEGGLAHIFAISGLHISLAGMGVYMLLRRLHAGRITGGLFSLVLLFLYIEMVGWTASSLRSYVMFLLWVLARMTGRSTDPLTSLAAAALCILISRPDSLIQSGFQLSFLAILTLHTLVPLCCRTCGIRSRTGKTVLSGICLQAGMLPCMLYYYYQFTPWSVLVNLLVLPAMSLVLLSGAAASVLYYIHPWAARFTAAPCHYLLGTVKTLCELELQLPFAVWVRGRPSAARITGYVLLVLLSGWGLHHACADQREDGDKSRGNASRILAGRVSARTERRPPHGTWKGTLHSTWRRLFCGTLRSNVWIRRGIWLLILLGEVSFLHAPQENNLQVTCLDVGQGDAVLIRIPGGPTALVDGGSTSARQIWRYCLEPALKYYGIRTIDWWIVTHTDADHISGLQEYLDLCQENRFGQNIHGITLSYLAFPVRDREDEAKTSLIRTAEKHGIPYTDLCRKDTPVFLMDTAAQSGAGLAHVGPEASKTGDQKNTRQTETRTHSTEGWEIQVLAPDGMHFAGDKNQDCLVLMLRYRSFRMLLTGDLEKEGEEFLAGQEIPLAADVLKVGHHGSRSASSEKFLNRVRPCVSVISCSATNNYGHPAPETLERLEKAGSLVCVTKDCGAVTIQTNGMRYQVRTFFER